MKLTLAEFRDKVEACWLGKNIGGTLGAPFECKRGVFDVSFYTQDLQGEPLPNDDLDLQIIWLNAVEKYGKFVNSSILGEYWHSYVVPNWAEYGAGKSNMRAGIMPPLSGFVNNAFRDSNGSFILSEIWACLAPGHPEIAVRYAYEDAVVDHAGEGLYAEIFCAALESAAFAQADKFRLIEIARSYLPEDCGIQRAIDCVLESWNDGDTWQEARIKLLSCVPASFGCLGTRPEDMDPSVPFGPMGYDAPSNIGITLIGWLYGEDDFGKSLCIAVNCGEDTDCTAGTLGAVVGIIGGTKALPEKWTEPLGGLIKTLCLNKCDSSIRIPNTVEEMTERVLRAVPSFLPSELCDTVGAQSGYTIEMNEGEVLFRHPERINAFAQRDFFEVLAQSPFGVRTDHVIFETVLDYTEEPYIEDGVPKKFILTVENHLKVQQWLEIHWHLPEEFAVSPANHISVSLEQYHCNIGKTQIAFEVTGYQLNRSRYDLVIEIQSVGRHTKGLIPVTLIHHPCRKNVNKNREQQ